MRPENCCRQRAGRAVGGIQELFRGRDMFLRPRFGWYGMVVLPSAWSYYVPLRLPAVGLIAYGLRRKRARTCDGRHGYDPRRCGGSSGTLDTAQGPCSTPDARVQRGSFCRCLVARLDRVNGCEMGRGALHPRHLPSVMSGPDIRVSAVLVSYNSKEDLSQEPSVFVGGDRAAKPTRSSWSTTIPLIRPLRSFGAVFPEVRFIEAGKNLGFGGAVNLAAVQARGRTLLVLNPDLRIRSQAIDALVARVDRAGGVAGPVLYEPASGKRLYGIRFDLMGLPIPSERPMPAFYVQGCALAISSALFRHIGGFDERYFLFAEGPGLCWRAAASGAPVDIVLEAEAVHSGGGSEPGGYVKDGVRLIADRRFSLRERNTFAMFLANAPLLLLVVHVPLHILKTGVSVRCSCCSGIGSSQRLC